ncbi:hypothetical protein [Streptomyces sp. NPDC101150]|uniref:RipA family octameric membrane protein n=1 Tax=Streptomyces sp. NPDC101150 TaxID=3366114 RepID=UPI0037F7F19E
MRWPIASPARRAAANSFFLGIRTTLLAAVGLADSTLHNASWYAALPVTLAGCTISAFWWLQLRSYQLLNQAKFEVINKLEEQLPAKIYTDEWTSLTSGGLRIAVVDRFEGGEFDGEFAYRATAPTDPAETAAERSCELCCQPVRPRFHGTSTTPGSIPLCEACRSRPRTTADSSLCLQRRVAT